MTEKITWAIIGCGNVCEIKSGPGFQKTENSELKWVMRRDLAKAEDYATRHNVPFFTNDVNDIFDDEEVNAVYISTPPSTHLDYVRLAAENGCHIYVEKPMALNYNQCLEMIEVTQEYEVNLFVAYYRRHLSKFLKIKQIIDQKTYGNTISFEIKLHEPFSEKPNKLPWRLSKEISGGGYFVDKGSHQIDLLQFFFGGITSFSGSAYNQGGHYSVEDTIVSWFEFETGVTGTGNWCFVVNEISQSDEFKIYFENGHIEFSFFDDGLVTVFANGKKTILKFEKEAHVQQPTIEAVVKSMLDGTATNLDLKEAAFSNLVIDEILMDYDQFQVENN